MDFDSAARRAVRMVAYMIVASSVAGVLGLLALYLYTGDRGVLLALLLLAALLPVDALIAYALVGERVRVLSEQARLLAGSLGLDQARLVAWPGSLVLAGMRGSSVVVAFLDGSRGTLVYLPSPQLLVEPGGLLPGLRLWMGLARLSLGLGRGCRPGCRRARVGLPVPLPGGGWARVRGEGLVLAASCRDPRRFHEAITAILVKALQEGCQ